MKGKEFVNLRNLLVRKNAGGCVGDVSTTLDMTKSHPEHSRGISALLTWQLFGIT